MLQKKILVFRHSDNCPPSNLTEYCLSRGFLLDEFSWYKSVFSFNPGEYIGLVILGGPQNVDEDSTYPWLQNESVEIKKFMDAGKPIFGICLGGQLLAQILGADVRRHEYVEAGWQDITLTPSVSCIISHSPSTLRVFQWHAYRFKTPVGAIRFATNTITEDQGFLYGNHIVGVQFHPEADLAWITQSSIDSSYPQGEYVQSSNDILKEQRFLEPMKTWFFATLDKLLM